MIVEQLHLRNYLCKVAELEFRSSQKFLIDTYVFQEGNALFQRVPNNNFEAIIGNITFNRSEFLEIHSYDIVNKENRVVGLRMKG